jgi:exodeoxyribonuclease VII small subunit
MTTEKESLRYQSMLNEVESIVEKLNHQQLDLDDLVGHIERGYELLNKMRERLDQTKEKIDALQRANDTKTE